MIYEEKRYTEAYDADKNGEIRPAALLRYAEAAADRQLLLYGPTPEELRARKNAFVFSRLAIDFLSPVFACENLKAETFAVPGRGYSFPRGFRLLRNGETVFRASSVFALIDTETRKPLPYGSLPLPYTTEEAVETTAPIRFPRVTAETEVGTHRVTYRDTDQNGHMNNTCYVDMISEFIPLDKVRIAELSLAFLSEAPCGCDLRIFREERENGYAFCSVLESGITNFEAVLRTEMR